MHPKKMLQERTDFATRAATMGVPISVIAAVLGVNYATVNNAIGKLRQRVKPLTGNELHAEMFKLYVWAANDPAEFDLALGKAAEMARALHAYLKLRTWNFYCEGIYSSIKLSRQLQFDPEIPLPYRRLFATLCQDHRKESTAPEILTDIIKMIYETGNYPEPEQMGNPRKAVWPFVQRLMETDRMRTTRIPFVSKEMFLLLQEHLGTLWERGRTILSLFYGLDGEAALTLEETSQKIGRTRERTRQLKEKALRTLQKQRGIRFLLLQPSSYQPLLLQQEAAIAKLEALGRQAAASEATRQDNAEILCSYIANNRQAFQNMPDRVVSAMTFFFPEFQKNDGTGAEAIRALAPTEFSEETLNFLLKPIRDLELSVRSYNILKDLKHAWKLCQMPEHEMLKQRNFGKKSLKEITELLASKGLSVGTQFDQRTVSYFQHKTGA